MKSLVKKSTLLLMTLSFLFVFTACQKDGDVVNTPPAVDPQLDVEAAVTFDANTPGVGYEGEILNHVEGHGVNLDVTQEYDLVLPDGSSHKRLLVDGCIAMTEDELRDLISDTNAGNRQYRTTNLVSISTIRVMGWNSGPYALTSTMNTALSWAVDNYNALNTNKTFTLSFGTNSNNADIVVYRNPYNSGAGAVAGFPSGGRPYKWVELYNGLEAYNTNVKEHVITHEVGHCMGMRHTDYASRASCGQNSNEGSAGVGAIHVPGTPTGIDWNSVMLACFSNNEDGEFGYYDRVALEYLY